MSHDLMFKDFDLKTDKLDSEFTLRIPEVAKRRIDQFLYAEDYEFHRCRYLNSDD